MKKMLTGPIRFYQKNISPLTPPTCRYHPTCSTYALHAVEKHGAVKGGVMGLARIIRCNPFIDGGVDRVPDYFTVRRNPDNIDEFYIPEYLMPADNEVQEKLDELLAKYQGTLKINDRLPSSYETLQKITTPTELSTEDIRTYFTKDELSYLIDIEIFPDLESEDYRYFKIEDEQYLKKVEPYFEDTELGMESPLLVLEKTGIWYTNLPDLARAFMIERGVTDQDIENKSYHLWLVLSAMEESAEK